MVDTALRLLDERGLEGLTLRRVADALDVQAPALYWHFRNKQELLDEMATAMFRELRSDAGADTDAVAGASGEGGAGPVVAAAADWQEALTEVHRRLRRMLLRHRDGAKVFSGTRLTDASHAAWMEGVLDRLVAEGFTVHTAARASFIAFSFTEGFVIEEQAVQPMPGEWAPGYDMTERAERIGSGYPLAAAVGDDIFADFEARFEEGLAAVVAGIAATLAPRCP